MTDELTVIPAGNEGTLPAGGGEIPVTQPEGDPVIPSNIPYSRFKEILDAKKTLEAKVLKIEDDQKKARQADLEKKGEYKKLLEEQTSLLESYKSKADQYDAYQESRKTELLEKLPEGKREKFQNASLELLEETISLIVDNSKSLPTNQAPAGVFSGYKSLTEATEAKLKGEITDEQFGQIRSQFIHAAHASHNR